MTVDTNHALLAQKAAEDRLDFLWSLEDDDEDLGLYCGCTTCIVREVLEAATPELWQCFVAIAAQHGVEISPQLRAIFDQ